MESRRISSVDQRDVSVARAMHDIFQRAYAMEARWIGADDFPPLRRSARDLQAAQSRFFGCWEGDSLAALAEVTRQGSEICLCSLVVDPAFFRRGLASDLLRFVLDSFIWQTALVETATENAPALALYRKFGFVEDKSWRTSDGIDKVQLRIEARPDGD